TNPASAAMAGFKVVVVPSNSVGMVDLEELANVAGPRTAGLMITNPNTLGIFERNILEIATIIHKAGGLLYYDGANFNPQIGKIRSFHGNIGILARAYAYILNLGADGLKMVAETAVLNTNYVLSKVLAKGQYQLPFAPQRKHEFVLSAKGLSNTTGIRAMDLA